VSHTIVLGDHVEAAAIAGWARLHGEIVKDVARGHSELAERRWRSDDGSEIVHLQDHVGEVRYVVLLGPRELAWAVELRAAFDTEDPGTLLASMQPSADPRSWIRALSKLAVCRPIKLEGRWLAAWDRALEHPSRPVRRAAIRTCYGCAWPELVKLVERRRDTESELAAQLDALLVHLRRLGA
jgi:hypothetical protein